MNTCATCKWRDDTGWCHLTPNSKTTEPSWFCPCHSTFLRERDRLEIAKAALAGMLAQPCEEGRWSIADYTTSAVKFADALLSELEKSDD